MELIIKPFYNNSYPKKGILIKGESPLIWLSEMDFLGIDLNQVKSYAVPSTEPNVLYGCLLVFDSFAPKEIGRNIYFQCVDNKFFIPENTIIYPKINDDDWRNIDQEYLIMHPDFGFVKLAKEIDWISLLQEPERSNDIIRKAVKGIEIPQKIERFTVEINDEKILESLQNPKTEEEWMKDLPFDLKKVMAGNKKEIEKYLKYLEKYPDRVADLGIPLDVAGTSRDDGFAKFKFDNTWFNKFFGNQQSSFSGNGTSGRERNKWIIPAFLVVMVIIRMSFNFNKDTTPKESAGSIHNISDIDSEMSVPIVAYKSGVTDIDLKIDSMYGLQRRRLMAEHIKASLSFSSANDKSYEEYLKEGGRPINEIQEDIININDKTNLATDSLVKVYGKKIVKFLAQNEPLYKKKITDSLKKSGSGKPADEGVVSMILKKKKVLIEDSLGRLYGTKESPEPKFVLKKAKKIQTLDTVIASQKNDVSFLDIIYLIAGIVGIVGLYSYFFRKKTLNMGGDNIPFTVKASLVIILLGMLVYLFYPVIKMFGYNLFTWFLIICVILLLYYLFSEDKTILKSDKNE